MFETKPDAVVLVCLEDFVKVLSDLIHCRIDRPAEAFLFVVVQRPQLANQGYGTVDAEWYILPLVVATGGALGECEQVLLRDECVEPFACVLKRGTDGDFDIRVLSFFESRFTEKFIESGD